MLYGVGLTPADMQKAQVGICSMWYEGNTCNMHLNELSAEIKRASAPPAWSGCGSTPSRQRRAVDGHEGMSYSLPSRDLIADSIETVMRAQWYDALITVPAATRNMPAA